MPVSELKCAWAPGEGYELNGRFYEYGHGTPCEGPVAVGDPFVANGIYDADDFEDGELAFCDRHLADRADDV